MGAGCSTAHVTDARTAATTSVVGERACVCPLADDTADCVLLHVPDAASQGRSDAPSSLTPSRSSVQAAAKIVTEVTESQTSGQLGFLQDPLRAFVEDWRPTVGKDVTHLTNRLDQQQQLIERLGAQLHTTIDAWHQDAWHLTNRLEQQQQQIDTTIRDSVRKEATISELRRELADLQRARTEEIVRAGEIAAETGDLDSTGKSIEDMVRYYGNANGLVEPYEGKDIINTFFGGHTQASPTSHLLLSQKQMNTLFKRIFPAFRFQKRRALEGSEITPVTDREFLSQMKRQTILMNNRHKS